LNLMKRLQKCRPAGSSGDPEQAFRDGKVALGLTDVRTLTELQRMPKLADKWGVCRMPGGERWFDYTSGNPVSSPAGNRVPYLGSSGWLAAVPLGAAESDAAFSLLTDLAGKDRSGQIAFDPYPMWGGGPTRVGHVDRSRWDAFGLDAERTKSLKDAIKQTVLHPAVQNPAVRLRMSDEAPHEAALLKEVRAFLAGDGGDAAQALTAAAKQWEQLDAAREGTAALEDYRLSVGLLPQMLK
jgi:ABC-type glycerol-3-phosphate transport system substrate-binding protein